MGPSSVMSKRNSQGNDPVRIVQVKIERFCSASECLGFVRPRDHSKELTTELFKIEDFCMTAYSSNDENSKLQTPDRSC